MGKPVKTYRALVDGLKVGYDIRNFHDLIPEAESWKPGVIRSYFNLHQIEEFYVDSEELAKFIEERDARWEEAKKKLEEEAAILIPTVELVAESEVDGEVSSEEDEQEPSPEFEEEEISDLGEEEEPEQEPEAEESKPKKKVVKKSKSKKRVKV